MRFGLLRGLGAAALLVGLMAARASAQDDPGARAKAEDARLEAFFRATLDETFRLEPLTATRLGDHRFDDRLDDISPRARDERLAFDRRTLAALVAGFDPKGLSRDGRIDLEIFRRSVERSIWQAEHFRPFEDDPRVYGDYLTESVYLLLAQSSLPREVNLKNALSRMALIPRVVEEARRSIGKPPKVKVETAIRQAKGAIGFYTDELYLLAGRPKGDTELAERAGPILRALEGHVRFLESEVLARSTEEWRVGRELFAARLDWELDSGISADEVLREAEGEADRVEREMAVIARAMWAQTFPGEVVPPDDAAGRRAMVARVLDSVAKTHGTPETLVADAQGTVGEIKVFIRDRKILALPEPDRCRIIAMPEFMRGNSVAYLNPSPPLDPAGVSEYAISPPPLDWPGPRVESFLREYNASMLKILSIHEAYPGHYVQLAYSNRTPGLIRRVLGSGTFAEGWAVYTEQMMLDQGFGAGDLGLRLQQLKFYLRAVVNAILDRKMHAEGMTDDQAMALLVGRAFQSEGEAFGKVIRSKQSSAQLSTYFVGRLAFYRLRQKVQRAQGDRFDLARFHEAVLSHGTIPVKYLPELVVDP